MFTSIIIEYIRRLIHLDNINVERIVSDTKKEIFSSSKCIKTLPCNEIVFVLKTQCRHSDNQQLLQVNG